MTMPPTGGCPSMINKQTTTARRGMQSPRHTTMTFTLAAPIECTALYFDSGTTKLNLTCLAWCTDMWHCPKGLQLSQETTTIVTYECRSTVIYKLKFVVWLWETTLYLRPVGTHKATSCNWLAEVRSGLQKDSCIHSSGFCSPRHTVMSRNK